MNGAAWRALRAGTPGQPRDTSGVSSLNSPPSAAFAAEGVFSVERFGTKGVAAQLSGAESGSGGIE